MPQGQMLILREDLQNPGQWENTTYAFDFKDFPEIQGGDTLASSPMVAQGPTPVGATALSLGGATISGTQVQFSITLPSGSPSGYTYVLSCTVLTAAGKKLVQPGTLLAEGCS